MKQNCIYMNFIHITDPCPFFRSLLKKFSVYISTIYVLERIKEFTVMSMWRFFGDVKSCCLYNTFSSVSSSKIWQIITSWVHFKQNCMYYCRTKRKDSNVDKIIHTVLYHHLKCGKGLQGEFTLNRIVWIISLKLLPLLFFLSSLQ